MCRTVSLDEQELVRLCCQPRGGSVSMGGRKRLPTVCLRKTAAVPLAAGAALVPPVATLLQVYG